MAARGRAAAAMAAERRLPSLDEFAGQSWSAWVERAGPPAEPGSGLELEESGKSAGKKLDAMTLIKEDMNIFGHCPAHDEFYLVVCNHCSQVVKPQAFQKHCERRHGPLSKLYTRAAAAKCHVAVNGQAGGTPGGTPGGAKALREKHPGARGRVQPLPERPDKDNNLCLFVPVVNLEKIPSIPKPDGHGIKVPPKAMPTNSKEPLGKPATAAVPKEPPVSAAVGGDSAMPADGPGCKPESAPAPGEKDAGASKPPPRSHKKLARKECDLNRQCGVLNPDTKKICTRLLTCKIHSVHQRREVQGRAKDFDVLVAELKASSRKGEAPKERSPPGKDPLPPPPQDPSSLPQLPTGPPSTPPCRAKLPHSHCLLPRARLSSDSDSEDAPAASREGGTGVFPFPLPKGGSRVSSEESEEEGGEEPPRPPTRPPRPQAFCTFGSRLVSPGCYVFNRRLDRFCSALGSMLERHLSSHMWRKIPPAAEPPLHTPPAAPSLPPPPCGPAAPPSSPPPRTLGAAAAPPGTREGRVPASLNYTVGSPHAAAACSQPECGGGGSQSITSPLPANIPSPSFSKLPSTKASKSSRAREVAGGMDPDTRKWKPPLAAGGPPYKRTCSGDGVKSKTPSCQVSPLPGKTKPPPPGCPAASSTAVLNGATRVKRLPPPECRGPPAAAADPRGSPLHGPGGPLPPRCISEDEVKKRKNTATYCRPVKPKPAPPLPAPPPPPSPAPPDLGGSVRRKKPGTPLGFEEKRSALKSKAH
ncbi:LOW QUALITY PROTEIN: ataxin-7-like protein 2 [Falco biarmicus]|uniref:LOW QUALITY PROTEIN: ataxin-7-like protein 2 n=1 Tax=Falco biarmicus TaxID=345155 RepID=UPI0024BC71C1|nr:LOW QUALITY PROTEIN: ataxin-7-like protein 2 [Falco biarmicus]